jgi:hypothetical protein
MVIGRNQFPTIMIAMNSDGFDNRYPIVQAQLKVVEKPETEECLIVVEFQVMSMSDQKEEVKQMKDELIKEISESFPHNRWIFEIDGELFLYSKGDKKAMESFLRQDNLLPFVW